jgi:phospholipid/cholesterol/gamma-HCH transport system substrate-binding protein
MIRKLVPLIGLLALVVVAGAVLLSARKHEHHYRVRAIFDNAGFVIPGEDVKIAGVKVGKISALDVTPDFKAAVTLEITQPGYQDFRRDASCIVRPQSLIGERFVECTPTQPHAVGAQAPPPLRKIARGPGKGDYLLPVKNTMQSVDIDLIGDTMREPQRERLSLILNELGTGVAGRGKDLNEVIRRADPALQETDRVLKILASQNETLKQLAVNSDTILAPLAREKAHVAGAIKHSSEVAEATAEKRGALAADIQTLPAFLDQLKPTMVRLGQLADQSTPVLADLDANADDINTLIRRLGPFSQAAIPAVNALGDASKTGTPAVIDARPVITDLNRLATAVRPVGRTARQVLESFQQTHGIERLMDYIFYQVAAINGFDAVGHYLRAELKVNQCATYAIRPVAGCSANFLQGASASSQGSLAGVPSATSATASDDPVLQRTAAALQRALGLAVEKAKKESKPKRAAHKKAAKKTGHHKKKKKAARPGAKKPPKPGATPQQTATPGASATPASPVPAPATGTVQQAVAPAAAATPTATASPTPTPTEDPSQALLDYLFGKDGGG